MNEPTKYAAPSIESGLLAPPDHVTPAPILGQIESLPFSDMSWEDFERLSWRILRDVTGHRNALIYGDKGQAQFGLDVVARSAQGTNVALQAKRYRRFGPGQLEGIVAKFLADAGNRPFEVSELIVAVSSPSRSTLVANKLAQVQADLSPMVVTFWGADELSRLLRDAPEVVVEFFGEPTARRFCLPFELAPRELPEADKARVREALARTPEIVTGVQHLLATAEAPETDPAVALSLFSDAQNVLKESGFGPYAAKYRQRRWELLTQLGSAHIAAQEVLDEFWAALDAGASTTARLHLQTLQAIGREGKSKPSVSGLERAARLALDMYEYPLAQIPSRKVLEAGRLIDRAKLLVFAAENALVRGESHWVRKNSKSLLNLGLPANDHDVLVARARLAVADAKDEWTDLLADARIVRSGYRVSALIFSRWARSRAMKESFVEADAAWDEATGYATLAGAWADAETCIFSRRSFRVHWSIGTSNDLLPLQLSISNMGTSQPTVDSAKQAYQNAFIEQKAKRPRQALIFAQRALRDAFVNGDWGAEKCSRQILATILSEAGELQRAAFHMAHAGDAKAIIDLGSAASKYIDLAPLIDKHPYWVVGTVYRLLAAEADLIPDGQVEQIVKSVLRDVRAAYAGKLIDAPFMDNSRLNGALKALAGVAERVGAESAAAIVQVLTRRPEVQAGTSRWSDESDAITLAAIADGHRHLRQASLDALIDILERAPEAASFSTNSAIEHFYPLIKDRLTRLALDGNSWAQECVAISEPEANSESEVKSAYGRLVSPLIHKAGESSVGTGAVKDSLLLVSSSGLDLAPVVRELMARSTDTRNSSFNRNEFMVAAANLASRVDTESRVVLFETALNMTVSMEASDLDFFTERPSGEFDRLVTSKDNDPRHRAAFLAASLAVTDIQRQRLRRSCFLLLVENGGTSVWAGRAMQRIGDVPSEEIGFLSGQGWALRVLAAQLWAKASDAFYIGLRLARDPDPRVRSSLARALMAAPSHENHIEPRRLLAADAHFSVRSLLANNEDEAH